MKLRLLVLVIVILLLAAPVAFAVNAHFVNASASINNTGQLVVSWKEAGLGNNQMIDYLATANGSVWYACINGGGKHPQASNKQDAAGPVSKDGSFNSGKNGQITASLTVDPPVAEGWGCPTGQKAVVACAKYTDVAVTDTTNNLPLPIPGTFSKVFYAIDECSGF